MTPKRNLLLCGLGLSLFLAGPVSAGKWSDDKDDKPGPAHTHRGQTKRVRASDGPRSYRASEIADKLKDALDETSGKKKAAPKPSKDKDNKDEDRPRSSSSGFSWLTRYEDRFREDDHYYTLHDERRDRDFREYDSSLTRKVTRKIPLKVVRSGKETGLKKYAYRAAVFGGSSSPDREDKERLTTLGEAIAGEGMPLLSGGGNGNPKVAARAAFKAGGYTVGFAQSGSEDEHDRSGRSTDQLSLLYTTGTGHGVGTIEREAPLAEQANIGFVAGGNIGTLGEILVSLYKPGVLAFLKGSGGMADSALTKILPHLGPLPADVAIVQDNDPKALLKKAKAAVDKLGVKAFPRSLVSVGQRKIFRNAEAVRKRSTVVSYLVDSNGMSDDDVGKLKKLSSLLDTTSIEERGTTVVVPDRGGLSEELAYESAARGVPAVLVSSLATGKESPRKNVTRALLAKGRGVGESAAGREVVQNAHVVVVAGGDYKTLSGLIYALNTDTVIAVLETGGMAGKLKKDIMPLITERGTDAKVIYGSEPSELMAAIKRELAPKKKKHDDSFEWDD